MGEVIDASKRFNRPILRLVSPPIPKVASLEVRPLGDAALSGNGDAERTALGAFSAAIESVEVGPTDDYNKGSASD